MNASAIILLLTVGLLAVAVAFPAAESLQGGELFGEQQEQHLFVPPQEARGLRFRRVTCDLLSVSLPFGSLNHSACAAHCLSKGKGFKGGRCKDGVCHCRR